MHGPFFASVCIRICQYVNMGGRKWPEKRRKTKIQIAKNLESVGPQGFPECIFFGNKRQAGASVISLAPTFFQKSKRTHSAAPPIRTGPAALCSGLVLAVTVKGRRKHLLPAPFPMLFFFRVPDAGEHAQIVLRGVYIHVLACPLGRDQKLDGLLGGPEQGQIHLFIVGHPITSWSF